MKQAILTASIVALVLAFALAGCGSPAVSSSSASSSETEMSVSEPSVSASEASEEASDAPDESLSASSASSSVKWTEAKDAKTAAVSAGLGNFAVPEKDVELSIGTMKSKDWTFRSTDGIAEADGYAAAAVVVVREGSKAGDCTTPLSDFIASEWPALEGAEYDQAWTQSVNDTEVTCFGNKEGVASKMIWNENQRGFSVQVLGQGDNWANFGIEKDDVEALVGAVIDANSSSGEKAKSDDKADEQQDGSANAEDYVESLVQQLGLGELVSYNNYQDEEGNWLLEVVTLDVDGNEHRSVIGADGSLLESDFAQTGGNDENAAANGTDGAYGTDGTSNNGTNDGPAPTTYSNKEAKQAVEDNGLGQYVYSQEVQGSDGKMYQEITTRDENGNNNYSYLDSNGDVVYDVDVSLRYNNDGTADPAK